MPVRGQLVTKCFMVGKLAPDAYRKTERSCLVSGLQR